MNMGFNRVFLPEVLTARIVVAALGMLLGTSCVSPEEQAQSRMDQELARQSNSEDVLYSLQKFAEDGSKNRVYINVSSQEVRQAAANFVSRVGGIPTGGQEADLVLSIETEQKSVCRSDQSRILDMAIAGTTLGRNSSAGYASATLTKLSGLGNSPTIIFASEAEGCKHLTQQRELEAHLATMALEGFRAPPCLEELRQFRPYYFRCSAEAKPEYDLPSERRILTPSSATRNVASLLKASTEANRLSRVYLDVPKHLIVTAANFVNLVGGTPVLSKTAEFTLTLEENKTQRCGNGQRPIGIFANLVTSSGNILSSYNEESCTITISNDAERAIARRVLQRLGA